VRFTYTKEDVLEKAREDNVQFIRLQFTDVLGTFKNIAVTVDELARALNGDIFFDSSVIEGSVRNMITDIYLLPDPATFVIFPWRPREGAVARLICDVLTPEGQPFGACSRQALKGVIQSAGKMGFTLRAGVGIDFFLFHLDQQGKPTIITHDQAGYCDLSPVDLGENARRDMVLTLQEMGFDVSSSHHEIAPGQHQIFLKEDSTLSMADNIVTFKFVVRTIAQRHGLYASFMPKPFAQVNGSGMHLHLSLWREEQNILADPAEPFSLSRVTEHFIAGLINHAPALAAITNPLVNSYKRLVSGELAPSLAGWSLQNRNTMIRIPAQREEGTQVIVRSPDPAANPYLSIAACLAAGLDGIACQLDAPPALDECTLDFTDRQASSCPQRLPRNLGEALFALEDDQAIRSALGGYLCDCFLRAKKNEWERYQAQVHQWELDEYLANF